MPKQLQMREMEPDAAEEAAQRKCEWINERFKAEVAAAFISAHRARIAYLTL